MNISMLKKCLFLWNVNFFKLAGFIFSDEKEKNRSYYNSRNYATIHLPSEYFIL